MENNKITKYNQLEMTNINYHHLTTSLLKEAMRTGLFQEKKNGEFQMQLMSMLSKSILKYTQNDSSSVKTEVAEGIMLSLLYNIDIYLLKIPSLEEAFQKLQETSLSELYKQGLAITNKYVQEAKLLLAQVKSTRLLIPLIAYNDTIDISFKEFFDSYLVEFDAHNTMASIDYPLLIDDMDWTGILYIKNYLEHLSIENKFCSHFSIEDIYKLLETCGNKNNLNWEELLINISELILKNAVCSTLIGKGLLTLLITQKDCDDLENNLRILKDDQIKTLLSNALNSVFTQYKIIDPDVIIYIESFVDTLFCQLLNALRKASLSGFIIIYEKSVAPNTFSYEAGEKLTDEELRVLIKKLSHCENGESKSMLIKTEIHNLEDLQALFSSFCIFDEEYTYIFNAMEDYELAMLASELIDNSPSSDGSDLTIDKWHSSENEIYWQDKLIRFIKACDMDRYKNIIDSAKKLQQNI